VAAVSLGAVTTAIIGTGGLGSVIARLLASGGEAVRLSGANPESARQLAGEIGGVGQSGRLEVGGDLHDLVVSPAAARSLIGAA
jgi:8-hydroxy-5-deazaflavin:NADPH oxidoreductase